MEKEPVSHKWARAALGVAAALLLDGDFPILSEYLHTLRKEMAQCGQ